MNAVQELWRWRAKLLAGAIIGYLLFYIYTETSSYPRFPPPKGLDAGTRYTGIVEQKPTYKWSDRPYQIRTADGVVKWGCRANSSFALHCPTREIWDMLIGKKAEVILLPTPGAKYQDNVILQMKIDGVEIVSFEERADDLLINMKNDAENWPIYFSIIGALFGVFSVMHWHKCYRISRPPQHVCEPNSEKRSGNW
ncbi:hypothetical protein [Sphingosinicella microcystinivorans]|uniref:hypothetical protein n=1 Tax=Sphingosinicella microcystinivorans TaxID=335406 RepID=UPI000F845719|nr:hypothetical protein [Sphingosinicella microcystinivorans]